MADKDNKAEGQNRRVKRKGPRLVLPEGIEPHYSNVVRISHTPSEMVFDFGQILPADLRAPIKARVLMTPLSAKLLHRALSENLNKYESTFGEIRIPQGKSLADNLFGPVQSPDADDEKEKEE